MKHYAGDLNYPAGAESIDIYRVQQRWGRRRGFFVQKPRRPWSRTWQAEWPDCQRAPRAWTRTGVLVKALAAVSKASTSREDE